MQPERQLVRLPLTDEQQQILAPYLQGWKAGNAAVFMTVSSAYDSELGRSVATMQAAILPWDDAKRIVNAIRKLFGLSKIPVCSNSKAKSTQVESSQKSP
jgi:hypothetical protein